MGKRASVMGTMLRARPLEEKAAAVQAFAHQVVPLLASGRVRPLSIACFRPSGPSTPSTTWPAPGKFGKVLLEFAAS